MRNILRSKRQNKKLTQQQIAEKLGISRSAYTNIENGVRNPSFPLALKFKEVLEYKNDDIFINNDQLEEGVLT